MKALVVEDSRVAREGLARMLEKFSNIEVVGMGAHADEARQLIKEHRPNLLFLDIHMPGENGFELLDSMSYQPNIIFTTAYSEYAIKSFDYQTVDYLLKPISHERLTKAIEKLSSDHAQPNHQETPLAPSSQIFIRDGERCHLVRLERITYLESCKNYARLYFSGETAYVKKSLNQLEQRLPSRTFFRANRQYIINLHHVTAIAEAVDGGYEVKMMDKRTLHITRRNADRLKAILSL